MISPSRIGSHAHQRAQSHLGADQGAAGSEVGKGQWVPCGKAGQNMTPAETPKRAEVDVN